MIRTHDPGAPPSACAASRGRPPVPWNRGGFSLTELLAVLVIVGLGLALATPRMNLTSHRSETAVQTVAGTLMAAQRAAVARQHDVVVAFETATRQLRIHFDADNDGVMDAGETVRQEGLGSTVIFGRSGAPALTQLGTAAVSLSGRQGGMPAVTFSRGGNASEEGGAYLTTTPESNPTPYTTRAVVVDRATGRAAVFRYTASGWERRF